MEALDFCGITKGSIEEFRATSKILRSIMLRQSNWSDREDIRGLMEKLCIEYEVILVKEIVGLYNKSDITAKDVGENLYMRGFDILGMLVGKNVTLREIDILLSSFFTHREKSTNFLLSDHHNGMSIGELVVKYGVKEDDIENIIEYTSY